jgi:TrmH family RNA methyltransferase
MITSPDNAKIKHTRRLLTHSKYRQLHKQCVVENRQYVNELCHTHPHLIHFILLKNPVSEEILMLPKNTTTVTVAPDIFDTIPTIKGATVLAVVQIPDLEQPSTITTVLYSDGIQIPENIGAIIRSAVAFNVDALVISPDTCDPYHPASIRASSGVIFQLPILTLPLIKLDSVYKNRYNALPIYALDSNGTTSLHDHSLTHPKIVVIGSEKGLAKQTLALIPDKNRLMIPMNDGVESLNVAVSTGILLYQLSH